VTASPIVKPMTKKNTWLPGQSFNPEPGRNWDKYRDQSPVWVPGNRYTRLATPLAYMLQGGGIFLIGLIPLAFLGNATLQSNGGWIFMLCLALFVLTAGSWTFSIGVRRRTWRKKNTDQTGGVYVPVWQRTPGGTDNRRS
jgi:hypothetical protein